VERIREIYRRAGRGQATVSYRVVDLPNGRLDVVYTINEGDKTGVKAINFVGNNAISGYRLRNVMTTTESNFLSFFKNSDIYDPDRLAADQELIRRYYLRYGYADFRIVNTDVTFDAAKGGYIVTITIDEGPQYRVGSVAVDSRLRDVGSDQLRRVVQTGGGQVYNAEAVERSLQLMTTEVAKRGYAFAQVRPQGNRNPADRIIDLVYVVEEGPRVYIERINVIGNNRTQDHVVRREFDVEEGDAYNKVLIDKAEKRLNALGYFKKVRITNEPGSAPDKVVINVFVEDQPTGQFSIAGGYSTADGFIGEIGVTETNFLGRGQRVTIKGSTGQYTRGIDFSFTEPFFMGYRLAAGFDLFSKYNDNSRYSAYIIDTTGGTVRVGVPITDEFTVGVRYSLYSQRIIIPNTAERPYFDCQTAVPGVVYNAGVDGIFGTGDDVLNCLNNGEASVAIKTARGRTITSLAGLSFSYSTLDNPRDPRNGFYSESRYDVAGLGGDSKFFRTSSEIRYYHELFENVVGFIRLQGGQIYPLGNNDQLRIVDHNFLGPNLVRGFAPSGIGPRDITNAANIAQGALGATTYYGGSVEMQFPLWGVPREFGLRGAVFADAGTAFGFKAGRKTRLDGTALPAGFQRWFDLNNNGNPDCVTTSAVPQFQNECIALADSRKIRSSVGVSLLWSSPLGPIRFDYAWVMSKAPFDRTQAFRFQGGASF
jgi:outer membrane protein insertion porin family